MSRSYRKIRPNENMVYSVDQVQSPTSQAVA